MYGTYSEYEKYRELKIREIMWEYNHGNMDNEDYQDALDNIMSFEDFMNMAVDEAFDSNAI